MRIERKQRGRTSPIKVAEGACLDRTFDGYHLVLHLIDSEGRNVRVILERHEAQRVAVYVLEQLEAQHTKVEELRQVAQQVLR